MMNRGLEDLVVRSREWVRSFLEEVEEGGSEWSPEWGLFIGPIWLLLLSLLKRINSKVIIDVCNIYV